MTYIGRQSLALIPLIAAEAVFSYYVITKGVEKRGQAYKEQLRSHSYCLVALDSAANTIAATTAPPIAVNS